MSKTPPQKLLSVQEAAKRLNEPVKTIELWIDCGLLEMTKTPGGFRRVEAEVIGLLLQTPKGER